MKIRIFTLITGSALILMSQLALASDAVYGMEHLRSMPILKISVQQGEWVGNGIFNTNGVVVRNQKPMNVCIKDPKNFLRMELGGIDGGKYLQNNCSITLYDNKADSLNAKYICVPYGMVNKAISFYKRNNDHISGFPAYNEEIYLVSTSHGEIDFKNVKTVSKTFNGKRIVSKVASRVYLTYTGKPCVEPVKIPTNAELKKEGRHVDSNKQLEKALVHRLGKNPFKQKNS